MMTTSLLVIALLLSPGAPMSRRQSAPEDPAFRAAYTRFLAAVRRNDKQAIADLISFPVQDWSVERKGDVQTESIKDRADFLARYPTLVTPFMRRHAAGAKVSRLSTGDYVAVWRDAGAEFSFEFAHEADGGYRVRSYSIGPE